MLGRRPKIGVEKILSLERIEDRLPVEELVARLPSIPVIDAREDEDPDDTVAARLENDAAGNDDEDDDNGSLRVSVGSFRAPSSAGWSPLAPSVLRGSSPLMARRVDASCNGVEGGEVAVVRP